MLRQSSVPRPRLLKLPVPGGRFVNALAFPNSEAFVAIKTQGEGELAQREMRTWRKLSRPVDH